MIVPAWLFRRGSMVFSPRVCRNSLAFGETEEEHLGPAARSADQAARSAHTAKQASRMAARASQRLQAAGKASTGCHRRRQTARKASNGCHRRCQTATVGSRSARLLPARCAARHDGHAHRRDDPVGLRHPPHHRNLYRPGGLPAGGALPADVPDVRRRLPRDRRASRRRQHSWARSRPAGDGDGGVLRLPISVPGHPLPLGWMAGWG